MEPSLEPTKRTAAGDAFSDLLIHIFRLNDLLLAAGDEMARPVGQTSARWRVLAAIENQPMSVAQIARMWGLSRQSVQRVANALVRDGSAIYQENPNHRRAQLLALTPKGQSALKVIQDAQRVWANTLGEAIGETDLREANEILSRVLQIVE